MSQPTDRPPACFWNVQDVRGLDFDPFLAEALDRGGLRRIRLPHGKSEAWLAVKCEDVKFFTCDPRLSRRAVPGRDITRLTPHIVPLDGAVTFADPPEHTRLRKTVSEVFSTRAIARLRPRAEEIVDRLLDEMERCGPPADVMKHLNTPFSVVVMSELMGVPEDGRPKVADWAGKVLSAGSGREISEQAKAEIAEYFDALATERLATPQEDLLSHMAEAERRGELSRRELVAFAVAMQTMGINSVRFASANMIYLLLTHPEHHARLRREPELLPRAVEELLRYIPHRNAVGIGRVATEDVPYGKVTIRRGEPVYSSYLAANRDPEWFEDPHTLDFDRDLNPHLAFGHGPHYCVGAPLARMECEVMLRALLDRFPRLRLAVPQEEVQWRCGAVIRGPQALPVTW